MTSKVPSAAPVAADPVSGPRPTSVSIVYQALRADLIRVRLEPGARLRIQELSQRYACGVIPIREALNRLTADGLVVHSEQKGFSAALLTPEDARDLTQARVLLSDAALRASIEAGDDAWEERVVVAYHRLTKVPRYESFNPPRANLDYDAPHKAFHSALISACGSRRLVGLHEQLFVHAERYRHHARQILVQDPLEEHRAIMEAALARDAERAVALARQHIELPARTVLQVADDNLPPHGAA